ncbi:hypothetical protein GCM10017691_19850 [Pseudonocardia petroleophila]|uniref:Lipoprotein with Yx(FWY)xxD motif n=1 Tax=Pseudonocardia petroleophila TaxID=37331 RepID=A0A7G7MGU8_9PSEU|nr:hypothetical protein [Pseudonocardia petroleophila]QNG52009.1 hypothetical protein H6H00_28710 [Pseudonocardia petroleophila]
MNRQHFRPISCTARLVLVVALAAAASGCAAEASAPPLATPAQAAPGASSGEQTDGHSAAGEAVLYAVQSGPLGVVVTDGDGRLLYRSEADSTAPPTSRCTDGCSASWQPFAVGSGQQPVLLGVDPAVVGSLIRSDGTTQVTLAGWPLYRDPADQGGLTDSGRHGEDDQWFVVTPTGDRAAAPS